MAHKLLMLLLAIAPYPIQAAAGFSATGSMKEARVYHTATMLNNGTVLVTGGLTPTGQPSNTAEIYNPQTGTWRYTGIGQQTFMNSPHATHTATKLTDGRVLLAGGQSAAGATTLSVEIFDPATETFALTGSLSSPHQFAQAVLLSDGRVMVLGGGSVPSEIYNPTLGSWSANVPALDTGWLGSVADLLPNGDVFVASGENACCTLLSTAALYTPSTNSVRNLANLLTIRVAGTGTLLPNGQVLIIGGVDYSFTLASTELCDSAASPNGQSQFAAPLNQSRRDHTATLLPSGDVLAAGGAQGVPGTPNTILQSAELWNHLTNAWSLTGPMAVPRSHHTSTLLPSGAVLVAGGSTAYPDIPTNIAELWTSGNPIELVHTSLYNDPSLISYWRFEGNSLDSKGEHNGVDSAITYGTAYGKFGQGVHFGGSGNILIPNTSDLHLASPYSISFWMNPNTTSGGALGYNEFLGNNDSFGAHGFFIANYSNYWNNTDSFPSSPVNGLSFFYGSVRPSDGFQNASTTLTPPLTNGLWYHVAVVDDGSKVTVYLNGVAAGVGPEQPSDYSGVTGLQIGGINGGQQKLNGSIDDLAIFRRALSPTEVANLYSGNLSSTATELISTPLYIKTNLLSYWRFEGNANDSKGTVNGTSTSVLYGPAYGKFGQGANFNGSSSTMVFGNKLNVGTGQFTMAGWVNMNSIANRVIFGKKADGHDPYPGWVLYWQDRVNGTQTALTVNVSDGTNTELPYGHNYYTSSLTGSWHHVAVVRGSNFWKVYLDGIDDTEGGGTSSPLNLNNTANFFIGGGNNFSSSTFNGSMDDAAFFNRALSSAEIYGLFTGTFPSGTINVTTNQPGVTFSITGPASYAGSGTTFTQNNAPAGVYTITYGTLSGYLTPPSQTQGLAGGSITFSGTYQTLPATPATASLGQPGASPRNPYPYASEPVNTATGNYYSSSTDLAVPGRGLSFAFVRSYNSADSYSGPLGIGWTHSFNVLLLQNTDGSVSIKDTDGGIIGFSPSGGGFAPATPGVFDSLKKNTDGSFTLTRKNQAQFDFSVSGQLVSIIDRNSNTQAFSYAGANLTSITDSGGRIYALNYDGNGRLIKITDVLDRNIQYGYDSSGRLTSVQDAAGAITTYAYDNDNRLVSATDPRGNIYLQNTYDSQGRVIAQKNARNFATAFAYNTPSTGTTSITDPLGNVTKDVLDGSGRLAQQIDALGGTTSYTYDSNNLKLSVTDPLGHVQSFTYDGSGNTLSITDPAGKTSTFTYDGKNNLLTSADRLGRTTTFTYDDHGNLLTVLDSAGGTGTFTYDGFGDVLSYQNQLGSTTTFQYDSAGNRVKVTDGLSGTVATTYDGVGRVTGIQNQLGKTTTRTYDADNRLLTVSDPLGNTTQYQYDGNGNLTQLTDANGKVTQYAYDATNKLSQVTEANGGITRYQYDGNTNLTAVTDANGHTTTYTYDPLQRRQSTTDPLGRQKRYGYDAVGNVISTLDGNGKTNTFGYDSLNRLASMNLSDGTSVGYTYDGNGNRLTMTDWRGSASYTYDLLNRVTSVHTPDGATVGYAYDAAGNRTSLMYPDGRVVRYSYDVLNRLSKVTDWASKATTYTYDAAGNLIGFSHPNGAASAYQYDAANRLLSIVNKSGISTLSSFSYALDHVGNRLQMTTSANGVNKYGYDNLYRLTSWTPPSGQATTWMYDPVGNRTKMVSSVGTTIYSHDIADELLSAGTTTFTYDGNGNQLTKTTGAATLNYGWDALNRLVSVTGGSINTQYRYDGDGNRVSQQVSSGTYAYTNDTASSLPIVLNESGPDGNITYEYGNAMIAAYSSGFEFYHQFDGLGSTINLTDVSGAQKANYSYDPWGKLTLPFDPVGNKDKYKFTGEAVDSSAGLVFLRARYYDSGIGRFVSRDRGIKSAFLPTVRSSYQYGLGNPLRLSDPSGLNAVDNTAQGGRVLGAFIDIQVPNPPTSDSTTPSLLGTGQTQFQFYLGLVGQEAIGPLVTLKNDAILLWNGIKGAPLSPTDALNAIVQNVELVGPELLSTIFDFLTAPQVAHAPSAVQTNTNGQAVVLP